jgi:SAM-dependent methyltransferase
VGAGEDKSITLGHPSYVWRFGQDRRLEMIHQYAALEGRAILDVGCGIGTYVRKLRAFSAHTYGVDVDPEKVAEGSATMPNLAVAPAERLPFADNTFDTILLHEVIEHVQDDQAAISEAYRCARPGGRLVIFAPNRLYPLETHGVYFGRRYVYQLMPLIPWLPDAWRRRFCPHIDTYRAGDLRRLFTRTRLPGEFVAFTQIYPGYDKIAARRPWLAGVLRRVTYFLEHTPLRAFGLSHFVVFQKATQTGQEPAAQP